MAGARWALWVLVAICFAARSDAAPTGGDAAVFPFVTGTTWTYAGTVKWTDDRNQQRSGDVRWNSEVVDAFDAGDVAAALLHGAVWDLAWWSPDAHAATYALLRVGTRYYLVRRDAKMTFAAVKASGRKALPADLEQALWFEAPLRVGQVYRPRDDPPRDDMRDGWWIESVAPVKLDLAGMTRATRPSYVLSYATLPDEERITLVPGVGITSFAYLHHGTTAEADVHLVSYHRGDVK
jgi:hypothetical protein